MVEPLSEADVIEISPSLLMEGIRAVEVGRVREVVQALKEVLCIEEDHDDLPCGSCEIIDKLFWGLK